MWRILTKHYKPTSNNNGPSWLTFLSHTKDSLWSIDFFRCESASLKSYWVMVVMDQFSRRIIGFAVHPGDLNGIAICTMFNKIISKESLPNYLSSDNDPLFQFHRWRANLRILEIQEIKSLPYVPMSHPFVERLVRITRNEVLDHSLVWTSNDLQSKLDTFQHYFNQHRSHMGLNGSTPNQITDNKKTIAIDINRFQWKSYCRGLFQLPISA